MGAGVAPGAGALREGEGARSGQFRSGGSTVTGGVKRLWGRGGTVTGGWTCG